MSTGKRIAWLNDRKNRSNKVLKNSKDKNIVLFDMDGTLTKPRGLLDLSLLNSLYKIQTKAKIGIVTGSDYDYLSYQLKPLLDTSISNDVYLMPCNGTKLYLPKGDDHELVYHRSMKDELGESDFKELMIVLLNKQANIEHHILPLPLTGHFISYRDSMINWCPIGRNASREERKTFIEYDSNRTPSFRSILMDRLKHDLSLRGLFDKIEIKLGGDTSFDIYPKGWNKTYCLKHFPDHAHWFVGDRCETGGNDKELYDLLAVDNKAFKTKDTSTTKLIIEEQILPYL